jgi:hypothetical protein
MVRVAIAISLCLLAFCCRGGNVTITGLRVEGAAVTGDTPEQDAGAALRQRTAAFNGSLGFFTVGLSIEVLGQFALKR